MVERNIVFKDDSEFNLQDFFMLIDVFAMLARLHGETNSFFVLSVRD